MIYHGLSAANDLASLGLAFSDDLWEWTNAGEA
jgi:hypothetical protein